MTFGLGKANIIDSLKVIWDDGKTELLNDVKVNSQLNLSYDNSHIRETKNIKEKPLFDEVSSESLGINFKHRATEFNDYELQLLLPQKQSTIDNALSIADVNNDGLDDIFIGNTQGFAAEMYIQTASGKFTKTNQILFESEKKFNDNNSLFFDADNDNDLDLYVTSGNYSLKENSDLLQDRLYINDGNGKFIKGKLPVIQSVTKAIAVNDIDADGDLDLFVGGRVIPGKYPQAPESYLLENRDGEFINISQNKAKELQRVGLINDAVFSDYDNDGDKDLILAGEWMPLTVFSNDKGSFNKVEIPSNNITGWFQTIKAIDFDNDGDEDYLAGNYGKIISFVQR